MIWTTFWISCTQYVLRIRNLDIFNSKSLTKVNKMYFYVLVSDISLFNLACLKSYLLVLEWNLELHLQAVESYTIVPKNEECTQWINKLNNLNIKYQWMYDHLLYNYIILYQHKIGLTSFTWTRMKSKRDSRFKLMYCVYLLYVRVHSETLDDLSCAFGIASSPNHGVFINI